MREEEMCVFLRIAIFDELKDCAIELSRSVGRAIGHVHIVDSVPDRTALNEAKVPALMSIALGQRNGLQALILSGGTFRSEEHTSELQSLMRISYAVFCL